MKEITWREKKLGKLIYTSFFLMLQLISENTNLER